MGLLVTHPPLATASVTSITVNACLFDSRSFGNGRTAAHGVIVPSGYASLNLERKETGVYQGRLVQASQRGPPWPRPTGSPGH